MSRLRSSSSLSPSPTPSVYLNDKHLLHGNSAPKPDLALDATFQASEPSIPDDHTQSFIFSVGTDPARISLDSTQHASYDPPMAKQNQEADLARHFSRISGSNRIFWYGDYHDAASVCSMLRANGVLGVRMAAVWAKGMKLNRVHARTDDTNSVQAARMTSERLWSAALNGSELGRIAVEFVWTDVVFVPGLKGHVQVPKHVLDHRVEDGDADLWGKLQRGLLDEMYLANGRVDPTKRDVLLKAITTLYRFGSSVEC